MARIRTIKPEAATNEELASCSRSARLLFLEMWCFCDDGGNHPASPRRLGAECFPYDGCSAAELTGWVEELLSAGLLIAYRGDDGADYWHVAGWDHGDLAQKIDRPTRKHPEYSPPARRELDESSSTPADGSPPEGKGREPKGKERKGKDTDTGADQTGPDPRRRPSRDDVVDYAASRRSLLSADEFLDYMQSQSWRWPNGQAVSDWQAAFRRIEARKYGQQPTQDSAAAQRHATQVKQLQDLERSAVAH